MRQGWKRAALAALFVVCVAAPNVRAAASTAKPPGPRAVRTTLHQFSGVVTAIDGSSLTVEKKGHSPRTMQFVRAERMATQGDVEAQARVTVWYRDEGGKATAHRVVVHAPGSRAK
jgi:hypothetical protein